MVDNMTAVGAYVFTDRYTRDECINDLQTFAEENSNIEISRNFYRQNSTIPEKDWSYYFGTFSSFKEAAGVNASRQEKKFRSKIVKEASVEEIRKFNRDKLGWEDKYNKLGNDRWIRGICISDVHDEYCDLFYRRMVIECIKDTQPQLIVLNGDIFDNPEMSKHSKRPDDYRPIQRNAWVRNFLKDIRDAAPDAQIEFVEGNHEYRLITYMVDNSPYVMDVLHLRGMDAKTFLGLDEFEINYHSRADFGTMTENDIKNQLKKNYFKFEDKILFHHFPQGKQFGMPGMSGHHHSFQVWSQFNEAYGAYNWYQLGCGATRYVDYHLMMGQKWQNGFMMFIVDRWEKKNTVFSYVDCSNDLCMMNGNVFRRHEDETLYIP